MLFNEAVLRFKNGFDTSSELTACHDQVVLIYILPIQDSSLDGNHCIVVLLVGFPLDDTPGIIVQGIQIRKKQEAKCWG